MRKRMFVLLLLFCSCTKKKNEDNPIPSTPTTPAQINNHVVLIIDNGIDPNHEAYRDKVLASFTLQYQKERKTDAPVTDIEAAKNELLDKIKAGEKEQNVCTLIPGISNTAMPPPSDVLALREAWNNSINNRDFSSMTTNQFETVLDYLRKFLSSFHGTNTTAMISYKNPNARFVLLEVPVRSSGARPTCSQIEAFASLDDIWDNHLLTTAINSDYFQKTEDSLIAELIRKYHVTLINKSLGADARDITNFVERVGCSSHLARKIMSYLAKKAEVEDKLAKKSGDALKNLPTILLQSAGNSGISINNRLDNPDCPIYANHLLIGSYNMSDERSFFSNYGKCVNLYNLGERVVTSSPYNFLTITDGTSFSTPLTVRYISFEFSETSPTNTTLNQLMSRLDRKGFLPPSKHLAYAAFYAKPGDLHLAGAKDPTIFDFKNSSDLYLRSLLNSMP